MKISMKINKEIEKKKCYIFKKHIRDKSVKCTTKYYFYGGGI